MQVRKRQGRRCPCSSRQSVSRSPSSRPWRGRPLGEQEGPKCTWSLGQTPGEKSGEAGSHRPWGYLKGVIPKSTARRLGPPTIRACEWALMASGRHRAGPPGSDTGTHSRPASPPWDVVLLPQLPRPCWPPCTSCPPRVSALPCPVLFPRLSPGCASQHLPLWHLSVLAAAAGR